MPTTPRSLRRSIGGSLAALVALPVPLATAAVAWIFLDPEAAWRPLVVVMALAAVAVAGLTATLRRLPEGAGGLGRWLRSAAPGAEAGPSHPARPRGMEAPVVDALFDLAAGLESALARRRVARRRAEQVERYESEFLSTVSHELRTPLNAILGFSQVLLEEIDGPLTADQREDVETIHASGEHLKELVDDVLDLARIESGLFTLDRSRVDVGSVMRDAARLLEGQRKDKPVSIEVELPPDLPPVHADPKRLRQIVMNLATNALKFTERGRVRLSATRDDGGVRISVTDTGDGIPSGEISTIFDEFTQVRTLKRRGQGAGLGLAICKRLVELHGGRIDVESMVGTGSTFTVTLPAEREA